MSPKIDEKYIQEGAKKVGPKDFLKVINKSQEIRQKFRGRGPLNRFLEDGRLLLGIVKDYWAGRYRSVPYGLIAAVVFVLIYVFNPFDLVPDFLPLIGEIDDAAVVGVSLMALEQDLFKYRNWRQGQTKALEANTTDSL